jgi:DNA mismatch endonuclease (patch repair protein)
MLDETVALSDIVNSECCKIPKSNREFWVSKIRRNQQRDIHEQQQLSEMGWHCIVVWECDLKPKVREQTLDSLALTLDSIWLTDHAVVRTYPPMEEEADSMMAAEERRT